MPKAGSSSIQDWLAGAAPMLRGDGRGTVLVGDQRASTDGNIVFVPHQRGSVNSGWTIERYARAKPGAKAAIAEALVAGLEAAVREHGSIIVSSEAFAQPFWMGDRLILEPLDALAGRCRITVAYYVRPQHTTLEAAWCQWGYRTPYSPSSYIARRARQLDYLDTLGKVGDIAPHVSFRMRPFRTDLLAGGDVVSDFAQTFLDLDEVEGPELWVNRGLPLEVVNVLRTAPAGLFWKTAHDNSKLRLIKDVVGELPVASSEPIRRSRAILHKHCHETFEAANRKLISRLGWATDHFIAAPAETDGVEGDLTTLDELWTPQASPAEVALIHRALAAAIAPEPGVGTE